MTRAVDAASGRTRSWRRSPSSRRSPSGTELAAIAAPFAVLVAPASARPPRLRVWLEVDRERTLEGDVVEAIPHRPRRESPSTGSRSASRFLDALVPRCPEPGRAPPGGRRGARARVRLRCARWSSVQVGEDGSHARPGHLVRFEDGRPASTAAGSAPDAGAPAPAALPAHTQAATGSEVARLRAEASSSRTRVRSSRVNGRSINWRATARRGSLVVDERHRSGTPTS